ncbi:cell division protein FtsA [Patescibacteria group bacterium]|nr:cell division protein FtsA [Patescibacteria group bacterium]
MAKTRIIAGIELGSSKVSTLIAQVLTDATTFEQTINIVGVATVEAKGIRKGQIVNLDEAVEATISSVEAAERMAGYNLNSAYIALGGGHLSSQNSQGVVAISDPEGEITSSDLDRVIEAASAVSLPSSREIVHVMPIEYVVDGESGVKDPVGMSGVRLEVKTHLITASTSAIKNIRKAINEVGVDIEGLVFTGLAASEAVLSQTEKELGCVCIDIGGGTTSVAAFIDGAISHSDVIPIGAKNITNDLAIGMRVSLESAEKVKVALSQEASRKGKAKKSESDQIGLKDLGVEEVKNVSRKTLIEGIIRPRLNEIFTMVRMDLDRAGLADRIPSGAIITGGGALTVGAIDSAKRMLALPVRLGLPKGVGGLIDDVINPSFATNVGLIAYGAKVGPDEYFSSLTSKFKLPSKGLAGKLVDTLRDLLP